MLAKIIVLFLCLIEFTNCAAVEVSSDGPAVLDIPIVFTARLLGEANNIPIHINQFVYAFEDRVIYPGHREEVVSGREANYTITYDSDEVLSGTYVMKVEVYILIMGIKGWLIAEDEHKFVLQNSLSGTINISQSGLSDKAIADSIVATNRVVELSAQINDGSHFLINASKSYTWVVDSRRIGPSLSPDLNYTFKVNQTYDLFVVVMCNILPKNITKLSQFKRTIKAKNQIEAMNVSGNTWLMAGEPLRLHVNCMGGDPPFRYCYELSKSRRVNYTCSRQHIHTNQCNFLIIHYFSYNGTYYIDIEIYNDVNFKRKTILVNVYDSPSASELSPVISVIPIVMSILAVIIVVVGIAYHLRQRQRYNTLIEKEGGVRQ